MKRTTSFVIVILLLATGSSFGGNGDLVVDGKLGVGISTPTQKLDVYGSVNAGGGGWTGYYAYGNSAIATLRVSDILSYGGPIGFVGTDTDNSFAVRTNGNVVAWFDKNSFVGIGTANPSSKLHIQGGDWVGITLTNSGNINKVGTLKNDPIGTYITGKSFLILSDETSNIDSSNAGIMFRTNNGPNDGYTTPVMVVRETGKVGIGTVDPAYTLDVNGTIRGANVSPSDLRLKENIVPVEDALLKVKSMQGVSFNWKTDANSNFPQGRHYGVIAQEIEKVLPEVVSTAPDGIKAVAYTEIIPVLIEAIKEQQKLIEKQHAELQEIRALVGAK